MLGLGAYEKFSFYQLLHNFVFQIDDIMIYNMGKRGRKVPSHL